ncbi:MAG: tetratricopeptide repeat protein [Candidatus Hydrogenedentes bacterium]|nr:tetratricopeptide repeat protein [Candidatus Hydrogenedentota bacterium]
MKSLGTRFCPAVAVIFVSPKCKNSDAYNNFGSTAVELGYRDEGAAYYLKALEIAPEYSLARRNMAKLFYRDGDYPNALKQFKEIADADPSNPEIYFDVVDCLTKMERTDEALSVLRAVENRFGKPPRVYREMGVVYLNERYDRNRAMAHFTQSLLLDGNQPDLRAIVGKDPTVDDLRKYYPPTAEIPEKFQDPNTDSFRGPAQPPNAALRADFNDNPTGCARANGGANSPTTKYIRVAWPQHPRAKKGLTQA